MTADIDNVPVGDTGKDSSPNNEFEALAKDIQEEEDKRTVEQKQATEGLAMFLKLHEIEVDYAEADWKDAAGLTEAVHRLTVLHPTWIMYFFNGDTWGIDSYYVFFVSKEVDGEVVEAIGEYVVNDGAELPIDNSLMMPVCPQCGKQIALLQGSCEALIDTVATVDEGKLYVHISDDQKLEDIADWESAIWFCPSCLQILFRSGQNAEMLAFLMCNKAFVWHGPKINFHKSAFNGIKKGEKDAGTD